MESAGQHHPTSPSDESASLRLALPFLGRTVRVVIDRPVGSQHPTRGFVYPANYGYVPHTTAPDGEELDAYYLGPRQPLKHACGECIAIVHRAADDDDKLIVVPPGHRLSNAQIAAAIEFQEIPGRYTIIRPALPGAS